MSTTDEVIGSIDHALRDFGTGPDAMRWTPKPAAEGWHAHPVAWPPLGMDVQIRVDTSAFTAALGSIQAAMETIGRSFAKAVAEIGDAFYVPPHSQRSDRLSQMHTAYRARFHRRTRSRR